MKTLEQDKQKCIEAMDFMKDWGQWRSTLKDAIQQGRKLGLSDDTIKSLSVNVGEFLANKVCPATKEEELLKEMWDVASPDERKMLASIIFRMME